MLKNIKLNFHRLEDLTILKQYIFQSKINTSKTITKKQQQQDCL